METRDNAFTLYKKGMGCTEIAKKLGVSLNTVKSWKRRYWDAQKGAPKKRTPPHPKGASSKCVQKAPQDDKPKPGAPLGNVNAVGNHGGAPPGNQNALKHGGWSAVMFGAFSEENQKAIQDCTKDVDAEDLLIHIASGFTEDGFITITPQGDGVTDEAGADGEVVISIPDDPRYEIKLVLQYGSKTNNWLLKQYNNNKQTPGSGLFNMQIKDLGSNPDFTASKAWVSKPAPCAYGKTGQSQEWTLRAVGKMEPKN